MTETIKPQRKMTQPKPEKRQVYLDLFSKIEFKFYFQERCVVIGFGSNYKNNLGIKEEKVSKPIKLDHYGQVEFVDANDKTCTIDQNGRMSLNGVEKTRIATRAMKATSFWDSHYVLDAAGDLWS